MICEWHKERLVITLWLLLFITITNPLVGQDITNLGKSIDKENPVQLRGNLFTNLMLLSSNKSGPTRTSYNLGGNLAMKLYGIDVPIKFAFRNSNLTLANTLNLTRIGLSPRYKSVTVHGGYRSMSLHKFLYSGQTFLGLGAELRTKNFELQALRGKLQNFITAIAADAVDEGALESYDRDILGGKVGFRTRPVDLALTVMKIKDAPETFPLPDSIRLLNRPMANLGVGLENIIRIGRVITWNSTVAVSGVTEDLTAGDELLDPKIVSDFENYVKVNNSSRYGLALESSIKANAKMASIGFNYKRIDANYRSLGLYQMNKDYIDYTATLGLRFFKSRLNTNIRYGQRQNNIEDTRTTTDKRNILSINLNVRPTNELTLQASYSDHGSERETGFVELGDSLMYVQASRSLTVNPSYNFQIKEFKQTISLSYLNQDLNSISSSDTDRSSQLSSYGARYTFRLKDSGLSFNAGYNQNENKTQTANVMRRTFTLGARKKIEEPGINIKASFSAGNRARDKENLGNIIRGKLGIDFNFKEKHSLGLTGQYLNKPFLDGTQLNETRLYTSYRYTIK